MPQELDPETRLAMFMASSPFYVDLDDPAGKDTIADRFDALPQNIQNVLLAEGTAAKIWNLAVVKHGLSVDEVKQIARTIRDILMGRLSAATLRTTMRERLGAAAAVTDDVVRVLTQDLISPNYFQISQLYERGQRKQGMAPGRPLESLGPRDDRPSPARREPAPQAAPSSPQPKNVVDLRGGFGESPSTSGQEPSSLPPTPPQPPPTPPPPSRPAPLVPPPQAPRGPFADRPTHGPLPPPL